MTQLYYAVTREQGPNWDPARPLREQAKWDEHAAFMDGLVDEGFIILGGPIGDGSRTLLIVAADREQDIEPRFAADPWVPMRMLRIVGIEPWEILLRA